MNELISRGYENLCIAVITQAVRDYVCSKKRLDRQKKKNANSAAYREAKIKYDSIVNFFEGKMFAFYCQCIDVNHKYIYEKIKDMKAEDMLSKWMTK